MNNHVQCSSLDLMQFTYKKSCKLNEHEKLTGNLTQIKYDLSKSLTFSLSFVWPQLLPRPLGLSSSSKTHPQLLAL